MESDSGQTTSVWMASSEEIPSDGSLAEDTSADVAIVGAGIAGMTTAYLLAREGKRVVILDDGPIGGGMTSRTTAHLVNALDDRFYELERLHGEKGSRLAAESHSAAIDRIEAIVKEEKIDCYSHQARPLHHLRHRRACAPWLCHARTFLGHARPLSLSENREHHRQD